jgi:hypothetical protein
MAAERFYIIFNFKRLRGRDVLRAGVALRLREQGPRPEKFADRVVIHGRCLLAAFIRCALC